MSMWVLGRNVLYIDDATVSLDLGVGDEASATMWWWMGGNGAAAALRRAWVHWSSGGVPTVGWVPGREERMAFPNQIFVPSSYDQ